MRCRHFNCVVYRSMPCETTCQKDAGTTRAMIKVDDGDDGDAAADADSVAAWSC